MLSVELERHKAAGAPLLIDGPTLTQEEEEKEGALVKAVPAADPEVSDQSHPSTNDSRQVLFSLSEISRTKKQPKEEVFGTDIPRTSGGHSRGYPGPNLRSGPSKSWKNKHFGADIHDSKARTSTTPRDFQKLRSEKLWAEFSFPNSELYCRGRCRFNSCPRPIGITW